MLSNILKELRATKDMTQADLAKLLGITQQAVAKWERGKAEPDYDTLKKLSEYFHVTTDYLLGNDAAPKSGYYRNDDLPRELFPIRDTHRVPIIGSVRCGPGGPAFEYVDEFIAIDDAYKPDEIRGFRAEGDSMEGDYIFDGDLCLVRLQDEVEDGALAVVVIDGEEGTLKHVHRSPGVIVLESSNPKYPPRIITGEAANTVRVIGKIVEVRHKK